MTTHHQIVSALKDVDAELISRSLATAQELLRFEPCPHPHLTAHELVVQAYDEILEGLHDEDYIPNLVAFFRLVMEKHLIAAFVSP